MAKIAILGFGTVGSGVYEVLCRNAAGVSRRAGEPVEVKYILDPKDFSDHPAAKLFIKNFDAILEDPEVKVVVETIGGTRFAYPYVKACLESGRSVCTSNKEMVATYGAELLALAKAHNCAFLFEASVGGGTPIITPMHQCLAANVITEVEGIVNGTTNFMLTKMVRENLGFDEALKIAQELGYAETKDPGDDVDGRDACRKIAILSSMVCPQERRQGPRQPVLAARRAGGRNAHRPRSRRILCACGRHRPGGGRGHLRQGPCGGRAFRRLLLLCGQRRRQGSGRSSPQGRGHGRQREAGAPPPA